MEGSSEGVVRVAVGGQEDVSEHGDQLAVRPATKGPLRKAVTDLSPDTPTWRWESARSIGTTLVTSLCPQALLPTQQPTQMGGRLWVGEGVWSPVGRLLGGDPGRPRARLWDGEVGSQEEDREGSQDARSSAHGPRRADTHPPVFSALPQPRRPLAPRAGQDEGLGMVGTHSQVGCSPPQTGSPCCVRCPPGARGEAGCHRLCPPRLPFSLSRLRVSPRHRLQVGSPASLWVRLSLHLLLFSVLLPPPLLSLSLCGLLCLSLPTPGASPMDISGTTLSQTPQAIHSRGLRAPLRATCLGPEAARRRVWAWGRVGGGFTVGAAGGREQPAPSLSPSEWAGGDLCRGLHLVSGLLRPGGSREQPS